MKHLTADQLRGLLETAGFRSAPQVKPPRPSRGFKAFPNLNPPSHTIWAKRLGAIWWGTLNWPTDSEKLTNLARDTGECFYVFTGPTPSTRPFPRVAERLIWWSRLAPVDGDHFVRICRYKVGRFALPTRNYRYSTGEIDDELFFKWENLVLAGEPPKGADSYESDFRRFLYFDQNKGTPTKPVLFQKSGPLELIWFSRGMPTWRKEYDIVVRAFGEVQFWKPNKLGLIRVHKGERLVGLLLRARFETQATWDAAEEKLESAIVNS